MCAIFGSKDLETFNNLIKINSYRGGHSYSIAEYDPLSKQVINLKRLFGDMPDVMNKSENTMLIGHVQAPTTEQTDVSAIHPSCVDGNLLWHNGIIKETQLRQWNYSGEWDTLCIAKLIGEKGIDSLSRVDGSFACIYLNDELNMFRNDNCPMFIEGSSFSSTKFINSKPIDSGVVFNYSNHSNEFIKTDVLFETKETFYWSFD